MGCAPRRGVPSLIPRRIGPTRPPLRPRPSKGVLRMITMTPYAVATPVLGATRLWVDLVAPKPRRVRGGVSFHNSTGVSATAERRPG